MNAASGSASARAEPVLIEELEVLASGAAVTNLLVSRQPGTPPRCLIVVTDDEVRALPLHRVRRQGGALLRLCPPAGPLLRLGGGRPAVRARRLARLARGRDRGTECQPRGPPALPAE